MKYRWLLIAIVALFVTGCEANVHDDPNRMTQQIVTDTLTPLTPNATGSPAPQPTAQSQSDLMARLYQVKAEQDAIEVELDNLEADYRIGKVDDVAFQTKKAELKALDKALDEEEDQLEDVLEEQIPAPTLPCLLYTSRCV